MKKFLIILYILSSVAAVHSGFAVQPPPTAVPPTPTVMVFGDSLSAGYGLPRDAGWVSLLKKRLQAQSQASVINKSISGETTLGGRNRIERALTDHRPDIVIVELGANDGLGGKSIDSIRANLEAIIEACKRHGAMVLLTGMRLPPNYGITYTRKFQDIFYQLAKRHDVKLVPFLMDGFGDKREFFLQDGIHPTAEAQEKIIENIWPVLKTMLKETPTPVAEGTTAKDS